jgi:hypothetical protein
MSLTTREAAFRETAAYGGLIDAIGGIATIVLAVCGLAGIHAPMMAAIATIVFGIALLIQGGTMLSEYAQIIFPAGAKASPIDQFGGSSLSAVFLVGAGGIVLGVLALCWASTPRCLHRLRLSRLGQLLSLAATPCGIFMCSGA